MEERKKERKAEESNSSRNEDTHLSIDLEVPIHWDILSKR